MNDSPAPGTPQTPTKAWVATGLSFVAGVVGFWIADEDPFTAKEVAQACLTSGISCGIIGVGTWAVPNKRK